MAKFQRKSNGESGQNQADCGPAARTQPHTAPEFSLAAGPPPHPLLRFAMRPIPALLLTAALSAASAADPFRLEDQFDTYPEGSSGEPRWEASHVGFSIAGQALRAGMGQSAGIARSLGAGGHGPAERLGV